MTKTDPVFARLAELRSEEPAAELSASLRAAAHTRLRLRRVHPAWALAIAASVLIYLGWALHFASSLYIKG